MMGLKKPCNYKRFDYYLRQCDDCGNLFKSAHKKGKYCETCKKDRTQMKLMKSYRSRGIDLENTLKNIDALLKGGLT